jgi:hypothetical protein
MYVFPTEVINKVHNEARSAWPNAPVVPHQPRRAPLRTLLRALQAARRTTGSRRLSHACHATPDLRNVCG